MIRFSTTILKFDKQGEKTGWTYIEISAAHAKKLNPGVKVSYRVKGKFDGYSFQKLALIPMGEGTFIIPLKAEIRKAIGKKMGDKLTVEMELDNRQIEPSADFMACLKEDPEAMKFFKSMPGSHQRYFSKWIDDAKTMQTKTKRIVMALTAFSKKQKFNEMLRDNRK
ncbi:MAG: YdeI/OmpD-associated family protein [Cyclobacteriaceae bacterium]